MIQAIKINQQEYEHFDPHGNSLGFLNEYENLYLRVQLVENKAIGYYFMVDGFKVYIDEYGVFDFTNIPSSGNLAPWGLMNHWLKRLIHAQGVVRKSKRTSEVKIFGQ